MDCEGGTVIIIFKRKLPIEKLLKSKGRRLSGAAARTGILCNKEINNIKKRSVKPL